MDTYEQKYKEALERAKNLHKDAIDMDENIRAKQCEIIFPELKESEDEKIRGAIIDHLKDCNLNEWAAWLEKQGKVKESLISQHENKMCKENNDSLTSEDERIRKRIIHALHGDVLDMEETNKAIAWLEKHGEQEYHCIGVGEPKESTGVLKQLLDEEKSWSEEDNLMFYSIIKNFDRLRITDTSTPENYYTECMNWLGNLKQRIGG